MQARTQAAFPVYGGPPRKGSKSFVVAFTVFAHFSPKPRIVIFNDSNKIGGANNINKKKINTKEAKL